MRELRGREMAMIFQSPRTALNPIRKVGKQIEDVLREHAGLPSRELSGERRSRHWRGSAFPIPNAGRKPIRSSSPAACASA